MSPPKNGCKVLINVFVDAQIVQFAVDFDQKKCGEDHVTLFK